MEGGLELLPTVRVSVPVPRFLRGVSFVASVRERKRERGMEGEGGVGAEVLTV